jgi:heme exporter protein A
MRLIGEGLTAARGGRTIFADLSFALGSGELLAVTGPNGAGKSTLLRLIAGLLTPAAGTIRLEPSREEGIGTSVHYFGHLDALKPALTLSQNLEFWRRLWGGETHQMDAALDAVGLGSLAHFPVAALSAGQKRRGALARMLLAQRPVWLLDEPTTALDAAAETQLGWLIGRHLAEGGMAIAATHRGLPATPSATLALGSRH